MTVVNTDYPLASPNSDKNVTFDNPQDTGVQLFGTLALPSGHGPFPAVVLVAGGGPIDSIFSITGARFPFADYLTSRGIAVLSYDKRGCGKSTGDFDSATVNEFASDVQAALSYLESVPYVDPKRIGLIGHSDGAYIAPKVAAKASNVAFVVMMAGPGLTIPEYISASVKLAGKARGASNAEIARELSIRLKTSAVLLEGPKDNATREKLLRPLVMELPDPMGVDLQLAQFLSPAYVAIIKEDPVVTLGQIKCPVLALNGSTDLTVPPKENVRGIRNVLKKSGNPDYTVKELPDINHAFQHSKTGEQYGIEEPMAQSVLDIIGDWIDLRVSNSTFTSPA